MALGGRLSDGHRLRGGSGEGGSPSASGLQLREGKVALPTRSSPV